MYVSFSSANIHDDFKGGKCQLGIVISQNPLIVDVEDFTLYQ